MKKIIIINFIAIVFIILFLELIVRFLNLSGLMGIDSGLIYEKNNINYLVPGSSGLLFNAKVYIDNNGYRVPAKSYKYKASKNLLFIGDSTTFGNGVIEEETFVGRLREEFNEINFPIDKEAHFTLNGGEPTLHPNILDIVKMCNAKGSVEVLSNGTASIEKYNILLDYAKINISLHH